MHMNIVSIFVAIICSSDFLPATCLDNGLAELLLFVSFFYTKKGASDYSPTPNIIDPLYFVSGFYFSIFSRCHTNVFFE